MLRSNQPAPLPDSLSLLGIFVPAPRTVITALRLDVYGRAVRSCVLCLFASSTALWTIIVCVICGEVVGQAEQHQDPVGLH
jgi:hypothetical protein